MWHILVLLVEDLPVNITENKTTTKALITTTASPPQSAAC